VEYGWADHGEGGRSYEEAETGLMGEEKDGRLVKCFGWGLRVREG